MRTCDSDGVRLQSHQLREHFGARDHGHRTATSFEDLRHSIMDVLMQLPHETSVHPGHTDPTTIGDEWERNAFIRLWRGLDQEGDGRCRVGEDEATLVLWAPDYDGGHKACVRWADGRDDIVPGSLVTPES